MKEEMCRADIRKELYQEIGFADFRKWMDAINKFRHLNQKQQDRMIETASEFPKLKSYLLEMQVHDGRSWK